MILKEFGFTSLPIEFSEVSHRYKLNKIRLTGTTTIINQRVQVWMGPWAAKEAVRYLGYFDSKIDGQSINEKHLKTHLKVLDKKLAEIKALDSKQFLALLEKAKNARYDKSQKALETGKISHALIQKSIEENIRYKPSKIKHEDERAEYEIRNVYKAWLKFEKEHDVEYYATEVILGDEELFIGGMADIVAKVDGIFMVIDAKTSKQISLDGFLQTANYKRMLILGGVTPDIKRAILRLDKGIDKNNNKIENFKTTYEYLVIPSSYEEDIKGFMGLYWAYKWKRYEDKENFLNQKYYQKRK